ncbi:MAG: MATE family efflux transporter [Lachnospiraceae bacterium]|nr:MATE family efflux transporter [Lachnospiraceae bacterium]
MSEEIIKKENPLGTQPLGKLLFSLAFPAIIANVVNSLYNIVDQIFIGQGVGKLGNAATSIAFPLTTICMAIGLTVGLGSASGFNLNLGNKDEEKAKKIAGSATSFLVICGVIIFVIVRIFLEPLLHIFGATENIMPYAIEYTGITSFGIPFLLFSTGFNPLVRADRSPKYSMAAIVIGAVLNTILDPVFIFVFDLGIAGAAWATVISQILSALILLAYFPRFKSVHFQLEDFIPQISEIFLICKLGMNSFIFQFSNLLVQITLNNVLRIYGEQTVYGADTPIAVAGIMMKINSIFIALIIGLINGAQPICSYNYGAKKYARVRHTVKLFLTAAVIISTVVWVVFETFPQPIISLFGSGEADELYFEYAIRFMRVYLFFVFLNGVQICSATFFPSIGKAAKGAILSFSKQIIFLIPLMLILPKFFGLDGVMYAQPITDLLAFIMAVIFLVDEFRKMPKEDVREK